MQPYYSCSMVLTVVYSHHSIYAVKICNRSKQHSVTEHTMSKLKAVSVVYVGDSTLPYPITSTEYLTSFLTCNLFLGVSCMPLSDL